MHVSKEVLNASEAAARLGVTAKALRLYEERGLVRPIRNAKGWRYYGGAELARASDVVGLRALGLSLSEVARVLDGDPETWESALSNHQSMIEERARAMGRTLEQVRRLRASLAQGERPPVAELARLTAPVLQQGLTFTLPWPWADETFEVRRISARTFITGPLGSGKTRFAERVAEALPGGSFSRSGQSGAAGVSVRRGQVVDTAHQDRIDRSFAWLIGEGATPSEALQSLLVVLEGQGSAGVVVDMLEDGLDAATQQALMSYLRLARRNAAPLFFTTRSSAILDLSAIGADETIIYCPANHSPPISVEPCPGAPGYEAVSLCMATPDVRARTTGVVATRLSVA